MTGYLYDIYVFMYMSLYKLNNLHKILSNKPLHILDVLSSVGPPL